jgi:hypothetical protein
LAINIDYVEEIWLTKHEWPVYSSWVEEEPEQFGIVTTLLTQSNNVTEAGLLLTHVEPDSENWLENGKERVVIT